MAVAALTSDSSLSSSGYEDGLGRRTDDFQIQDVSDSMTSGKALLRRRFEKSRERVFFGAGHFLAVYPFGSRSTAGVDRRRRLPRLDAKSAEKHRAIAEAPAAGRPLVEQPPAVTPSAHSFANPPRGEKSHGFNGRFGG